ncbi:DUF1403 family protein [Methylocystis sp. H4A]|uniref:DUF1403 family protein n=1 Tax=Methylocystis sp. H4A TaxID=2785788 RepID=UPI0024860BF4|nr:DUF1403 family protein [Methylocystis sp. H4A]
MTPEVDAAGAAQPPRGRNNHRSRPSLSQNVKEIRPLPRWTRIETSVGEGAKAAAFLAGANLLALDQILRTGEAGGEPCFAGVLRQRLALKAAATCARLARLREDAAELRDAEHLGDVVETSPAGRVHRLWRLFATRPVRFDATTLSLAAEHLGALSDLDALGLADALREVVTSADNPLAAAAHASAAAMHYLAAVPEIDAEIFALWLAAAVLTQKLAWKAPIPLLATAILHPALRRDQNGRRPRPGAGDWSNALAAAYALAACEAIDLAAALSRQTQKLFDAAPKLRAAPLARRASSKCCSMMIAFRRRARRSGRSFPTAARDVCSIGLSSLTSCVS